jgi:hypothetical protein
MSQRNNEPLAVEKTRDNLIAHIAALTAMMKANKAPDKEYFNIFVGAFVRHMKLMYMLGFNDAYDETTFDEYNRAKEKFDSIITDYLIK